MIAVSTRRRTRILRGDAKENELGHRAGYAKSGLLTKLNPDGPCLIRRSEKPAVADGTGAICRRGTCRRWWNWCGLRAQELQVLLVKRQRGQSCMCENLAKYC